MFLSHQLNQINNNKTYLSSIQDKIKQLIAECYTIKDQTLDQEIVKFLESEKIKVEANQIYIHRQGMQEDMSNFLDDGTALQIKNKDYSAIENGPFEKVEVQSLSAKMLGKSAGQFNIVKMPRQDQLVCFQHGLKAMPYEIRQMVHGNYFEQAYFLQNLCIDHQWLFVTDLKNLLKN